MKTAISSKLYFLAFLPPHDLREQIKKLKEDFAQTYHCKKALRLPVHITLVPPFSLAEEQEENLEKRLRMVCSAFSEIEIKLSGFGAFPPRVIFIKVKNPENLRPFRDQLLKSLNTFAPIDIPEIERAFRPHITLASRDLKKEYFYKAWEIFKNRSLKTHFLAAGLTLFKHNGKLWEEKRNIPLLMKKI